MLIRQSISAGNGKWKLVPGTIKSFGRQFEITLSTSIKALLYDVTFNGSDSVITVVSVSKGLSLFVIALLGQDLRARLLYKRWCVFFLIENVWIVQPD